MLSKKISYLFAGFALLLTILFSAGSVRADGPPNNPGLPESPGTYSVPDRPDLRVKVFVHSPNPAKPGPSPTPSLTCNLADPDSATVDGTTGWYIPTGQWIYHLNPSTAPSLIGATNAANLTSNAFSTWSATNVGHKVSFVAGSNTPTNKAALDGQNIIAWGRTQGSALAVTYTWYNQSTGEVAENDTIFNSRFAWEWSSQANCAYSGYYDAQDILTHELGHWMGLDDNYASAYVNNTMYGYGSTTEVKKDTLATGDLTAVNSIY